MKSLIIATLLIAAATATPYQRTDPGRDHYHRKGQESRAKPKLARVEDAAYWRNLGQRLLQDELNKQRYNTAAKNIIFFLGDGMSIPTITASRIFKGQKDGNPGEETDMTFDKFPYAALSRTYCVDAQVADSACSATAYLCGVKANIDTIGVDANVLLNDCEAMNKPEYRVDSIMTWAQRAGKGTGIVTTTRVTHATPAGTYAHVAQRDWEDDYAMSFDGIDTNVCSDIAEQLVESEPGKNFKVILGGGRTYFLPRTVNDVESGTGRRRDGKNLVDQWKTNRPTGTYVTNRDELLNLNTTATESILGLFSPSHLEYFLESENASNPTLREMTRTAIEILQKEPNGYILLVEGGRIDQAHHDGRAKLALEEAVQFDLAISMALNMTKREETLIIVTADHAHTMSINGYPVRGNPLLGFADISGVDNLPYTTLSYANGPGFSNAFDGNGRVDLTNVDTTANNFKQPATVPLASETHGGDDVGIFAIGPQAHMFQGVYEQNYIAHVMAYAACIGPGLKFCDANA